MESPKLLELAGRLGLDASTLELARVFPLVFVAWSDGEVQADEAKLIREMATKLGISAAPSLQILDRWLASRPDASFFSDGLHLLGFIVADLPDAEVEQSVEDLSRFCELVAQAAGGLAGHSKRIEAGEAIALRDVALRLQLGRRRDSRQTLRSVLAARPGK